MKNFKVGKKLAVVFGIVLALFIGSATVSGFCQAKVASSMSNFYNNQFQVVSTQYSMRVALQATIRFLLWACTTDSDAETEEYVEMAQEQLEIMKAGIPILQEKFQGDSALVADFQSLLSTAGPVRESLIQMARTNHVEDSIKMFNSEYVPLITQAQDKLIQIGDFAANRSAEVYRDSQRLKNQAGLILLLSIAASTMIIIFFCIYITRSIVRPIHEIETAAKGISAGKLDSEITYHSCDELGVLAESLRATIHSMDVIINDIAFLTSELAKGNFTVISPNREAYIGSFKPILLSIRAMKDHLSSAMHQISDAADQVTVGSDQISSTAQSLSQGASEQASSVEELSASINEISNQVEKTAENAKNASLSADSVGQNIMKSNQEMQQMMTAMANINESSGEIGKIIKTIEDIAFQTNILALNAAVEAARAGEAGKGFAVVADEVRNLASKSADASKNTAQLIENSMRAVEEGTRIADATAQSLLSTVEGVKAVTATISDISAASNSQADSILSITQSMDQISNVVQTNSATAEESAAASEELAGQSRLLKDLVSMFQLSDESGASNGPAPLMSEYQSQTQEKRSQNYSRETYTASGTDKY